jgi:Flp pilus assembly protein TadG
MLTHTHTYTVTQTHTHTHTHRHTHRHTHTHTHTHTHKPRSLAYEVEPDYTMLRNMFRRLSRTACTPLSTQHLTASHNTGTATHGLTRHYYEMV